MRIQLVRDRFTEKSTSSKLIVPGCAEMFAIELPKTFEGRLNVPKHTCVISGIYELRLMFSPHNKLWVPLLFNVPGRDMIEVHPANYPSQLLGCIAPGLTRIENTVQHSGDAFRSLMLSFIQAIDRDELVDLDIREVA